MVSNTMLYKKGQLASNTCGGNDSEAGAAALR